ncbi:hypothetical protein KBY28_07785 [Ruegeria pomeroyi]|uniref:hypothetical protein n=1 Tax=Ruegeria pomeroyi TaxID=89184 RepID=UPI001F1C0B84|nr:hypothetical protein [Ruegeria pomeroyi]MCE8508350.1 hypothetical protein [Ruegeria pomeroyi]
MPVLVYGALALVGLAGVGWAAKETGEAADSLTRLTKWGVVAGGLYVGYRAAKTGGLLK